MIKLLRHQKKELPLKLFLERYSTRIIILLLLAYFLVHLMIACRPPSVVMHWYTTDDAFYYFQVAKNIINGKGITFDGIGLSNGFHPLWLLLNLPVFLLTKINVFLPLRVMILISAGLTFAGGVFLFFSLKEIVNIETAFLGFLFWIFCWPIQRVITLTGMEAGLNAFMLLFFFWLMAKMDFKRPFHLLLAGSAAALVLFSRLDNIFFVLLVGVWLAVKGRTQRIMILLDIFSIFISVYLSVILRSGPFDSLGFLPTTNLLLLLSFLVKLPIFYFSGLHHLKSLCGFRNVIKRVFLAQVVSSMLIYGVILLLMIFNHLPSGFPRSALLIEWGLSFLFLLAGRYLWFRFSQKQESPSPFSMVSAWRVLRVWLVNALLFLLPVLLLFGGYLVWNQRTFGSALPISGQIKLWWGTLPNPAYGHHQPDIWHVLGVLPDSNPVAAHPWFLITDSFFRVFTGFLDPKNLMQAWLIFGSHLLLFLIYCAGLYRLFRKTHDSLRALVLNTVFLPLLTASILQPFYLSVVGYMHVRPWYWVMQLIITTLLAAVVFDALLKVLKRKGVNKKIINGLMLCLALLLLGYHLLKVFENFPAMVQEEEDSSYLSTTKYLESHTDSGDLIGMTGGGIVAFFIEDRTIVNLDGLINCKAYFDLMQSGEAQKYLDEIGLDYVFGRESMLLGADPYWWFFDGRLEPVGAFNARNLYEYLPILDGARD